MDRHARAFRGQHLYGNLDPGKRVVFTWDWQGAEAPAANPSTVAITLEPVDGGTNVRLVHVGLVGEEIAAHAEGWRFPGRLETLATKGDAGADDWAAAPDPINELISAEAPAIAQRTLATSGTFGHEFANAV